MKQRGFSDRGADRPLAFLNGYIASWNVPGSYDLKRREAGTVDPNVIVGSWGCHVKMSSSASDSDGLSGGAEVVPITTVPAAPQADRAPPSTAPAGTSGAVSRPRLIVKRPGSGVGATAAGDKGKKSKKDDTPSDRPLKKQKKGEASGSLADAFLGGGVRLDDEVFLQLGPRMTEALKDVSEEDAPRTAGELTLRLAALYTKFPRPERSRIEDLEKELAAAKAELNEAGDDRAKAEQAKAGEAADDLRKLQRRFDDLTLEHMAAAGSAADWQKKAKDLEAELGVADEQVFAQYEAGFQNVVDLAVFYYNCSPDRFDVHMGVVDGRVTRVFDRLDEVNDPPV
ncbi:hypothetical protein DEO72_LG4g34 [Vigna unguiculata]|uniref:Uncharacterized protein n=1 Tax=Vigna unguiculata TaxID=3917 RepID=A0A4D6LLD9_VIGUN|nr:hypothetical protein DEO72_LG4g34 [Vigna unguiculata]